MSDDRQFGEGQDNYLQGIRSAAEAAKQAGSAAGSVGTAAGEATANAAAATVQAGMETGKAASEIAVGTAAGAPRSLRSWCFSACSCCSLSLP